MIKVLIATPAYNCQVHIDYVNFIYQLRASKITHDLMMIGNESLITRARNTCISNFYHSTEYSHLFFIDADIGLPSNALDILLSREVDVVGCAVALKGKIHDKSVYNVGPLVECKNGLFKTSRLGSAVILLSRKAVEDLIVDAKPYNKRIVTKDGVSYIQNFDVFRCGVVNEEYLSEDFFMCETLMKKGYTIFVDSTISTKHNGMSGYF